MNVALGRQTFGRRCELHFVGAANDDAVTGGDAAFEANFVAVTRGNLDIAARESLAADLHEDIGPSALEQDRGFRDRRRAQAFVSVEHRRADLADEQLTFGICDFELDRQRSCFRVDDTGVVPVLRALARCSSAASG